MTLVAILAVLAVAYSGFVLVLIGLCSDAARGDRDLNRCPAPRRIPRWGGAERFPV